MKNECDYNYYNSAYLDKTVINYQCHYKKSTYYAMWLEVLKIINAIKPNKILELGCGVGQFANMLFDNNIDNYTGIDFSTVAIKKAIEKNKKGRFIPINLYSQQATELIRQHNYIICLETLEHLQNDLDVVAAIKPGTTFIFSLPDFDCESHVRYFKSKQDLIKRYKHLLNFTSCSIFKIKNIYYICNTIRK